MAPVGFLSLVRWLGPWSGDEIPPGVERESWVLRDGRLHGHAASVAGLRPSFDEPSRLEAYVYRPPGRAIGTYLVAPGLHFLGPEDPRLDRFCRVLARAGFLVVAPFVPAFVDLVVHPSAPDDLEVFARATLDRFSTGRRLAIFSISFGSWPALEVATRLGDEIDAVITFGGYAEFESAVRFCIDGIMQTREGPVKLARDPLNQPALFLNILPLLGLEGTDELERAWREMTYRTWGKNELKAPGALEPIAAEVATEVPSHHRDLFLVGCGVREGAGTLVDDALERSRDAWMFASPGLSLRRINCPVVVCHGRDDDVIPWGEAEKLHRVLEPRVPTRLYLTGLYGHTGVERPRARDLAAEGATLMRIAAVIAGGGALRAKLAKRQV